MTTIVSLVNATFAPASNAADPAARWYGRASPDGAGDIGADQYWPQPVAMTGAEFRAALNPLQHLPVLGMFYRMVTHETIPAPMRIAGSVLTGFALGGPAGGLGTALLCLGEELIRMGPDTSGPAAPAGFVVTGSEAGPQPVAPDAAPNATPIGASKIMLASEYAATRMLETGMA